MKHTFRHQFVIKFGYCGNLFYGTQPQKNVFTVGETLFELLTNAAKKKPKALCFSARTDRGVSAKENIATCWFSEPFNVSEFLDYFKNSDNLGLKNIQVEKTNIHTHARGNSFGKHYRYVINSPNNIHSWKIIPTLNIFTMKSALKYIIGTHDFRSFKASNCSALSSIKTIHKAELMLFNSGEIWIEIYGNAFLRKMIRIIIGLIVEIGVGLRQPDAILTILEKKNRSAAGITAPPQGLTLVKVDFRTNCV